MSITYYTGIPRSGKSYKAMYDLYTYFIKTDDKKNILTKILNPSIDKEKYINAYTNINQFNFDISDKIYEFKFDEFYSKLTFLYNLYIAKQPDSVLIEKATEFGIFKSLIVIDECHNYLKSKDDKIIVWWLTYHAHIHQDIILITQDLALVNNEYKRVAEFFFRAIPQRFRFSKNTFVYIQYSSYNMYQNQKIGKTKINAIPEIFDLYVSGSESKEKSIFYKYFAFLIFSLILLIYFFTSFSFGSDLKEEEVETVPVPAKKEEIKTVPVPVKKDVSKKEDIELNLFKFECYSEFCYFNDKEIPINILKSFLIGIDEDKKYTSLKNHRLLIYILDDSKKFNFLIEKGKNEKNDKNTSSSIFSN